MSTPGKEALKAFWNLADTALCDIDPHNGQRTAFDISRRLQGLLHEFEFTGEPGAFTNLIQRYAESNDLDPEDLEGEVYLCWDSVIAPEGGDPVEYAARLARRENTPEDFMPKAPGKVRRQAFQTLCICRRLSNDGSRAFFVSCRKLAEALEVSRMTASRLLDLLCKEGYIERSTRKATRDKAQYYRLSKMGHRNV